MIACVAVVLLAGAGTGVALKIHHDEQHKAALAAADARQRAEKEREAASEREKTEAKEHEETERKSDESELEKAVETDAKKLVSEGTLEEPIIGASCTPVSGGSSVELSSAAGTYNCLAITKREAGGESSGYAFTGNIDFAAGSFTYHLGH
jgi:sRNA-binding protein